MCDVVEIAKRTGLGVLDVRGFVGRVREGLMVGFEGFEGAEGDEGGGGEGGSGLRQGLGNGERIGKGKKLVRTGEELVADWKMISLLDPRIDAALGGGIPVGYITEITGERYICPYTSHIQTKPPIPIIRSKIPIILSTRCRLLY